MRDKNRIASGAVVIAVALVLTSCVSPRAQRDLSRILIPETVSEVLRTHAREDETVAEKLASLQASLRKHYPDRDLQIVVSPAVASAVIPGIGDTRMTITTMCNAPLGELLRWFCMGNGLVAAAKCLI